MDAIRLNICGNSNITLLSNDFIDNYMKDANDIQIKLYLYLLRRQGSGETASVSELADFFNYPEKDIDRALRYWEKKGVISLDTPAAPVSAAISASVSGAGAYTAPAAVQSASPVSDSTYSYPIEMLKAFKKSPETSYLITALQQYTGRPVAPSRISSLLYMYDALLMPPALIDYLMQYCIEQGNDSISFMEDTARCWYEQGIKSVEDAKLYLNKGKHSAESGKIMTLLGRSGKPAPIEQLLINRWLTVYGFDMDMISEACNRAVAAVDNNRPAYAEGILKSWYEKGIRSLDQVRSADEDFRNARFNRNVAVRTAAAPAASAPGTFCDIEQQDYDFADLCTKLVNND